MGVARAVGIAVTWTFSWTVSVAMPPPEQRGGAVRVSKILNGNVAVVDTAADAITSFLTTGTGPAEVALVEALNRAYVADLVDGTITILDTAGETVIATLYDTGNDRFEPGDTSVRSDLLGRHDGHGS